MVWATLGPASALAAEGERALGVGGPWSLLPALLAIGLALWTRQVVLSLFAGAWIGATLLVGGNPLTGMFELGDGWLIRATADPEHVKIVVFALFIAGMVGVLSASGATRSLVDAVTRRARTRRSAQLAAWLSGMILFFDDYANCLVVGNAMRPLTDRLGISRAKLAYIVDSTAAPIASLAIVSTWVGYEVSLIADGMAALGEDGPSAYGLFLRALPYRAYGVLTIAFVGLIGLTGRDYGPMLRAERQPAVEPLDTGVADAPAPEGEAHPLVAVLPLLTLVAGTMAVLGIDGVRALDAAGEPLTLFGILDESDGYRAMIIASISAMVLSIGLAWLTRAQPLARAVTASVRGMGALFEVLVVLVLAWTLGATLADLHTADFVTAAVGSWLPAVLLPVAVFLVSAATSFATGTSFGTMAILLPVVVPLALDADPAAGPITLAAIAAVLDGSCFGDHTSPISDTTVLSAASSGCSLVEHVRTQFPYATTTATLAMLFGYLPSGLGVPAWVCLPVGLVLCVGVILLVGRRSVAPQR